MKLLTVEEMRSVEEKANQSGLSYQKMMENAGNGLAEVLFSHYGTIGDTTVVGLIGPGNNGGDTLIALTHLAEAGWESRAYFVRAREEGDRLVSGFIQAGGEIINGAEDPKRKQLSAWIRSATVVVDGVLGTGISLPLRGEVAEVLKVVKSASFLPHVVAVDCPSGVDCVTGEVAAETIPAELTVCMEAVKAGLLTFPAFSFCGEIITVSIGDVKTSDQKLVIDADMVREWLPPRPMDAHKGSFGTTLILAGSVNYPGAALLAARSAYRVGSGLVTCGAIAPLQQSLAGQIPEATWLVLPGEMGVISQKAAEIVQRNLERVTAILLGPGFGMEETTGQFISALFEPVSHPRRAAIGFVGTHEKEKADALVENHLPPVVIDADGLKLLAKTENWWKMLPETCILTPHPGEMAVLTGLEVSEIQSNRMETARKMADQWGQVVVLKGALTVIAEPKGRVGVIPVASPALARAGTGDVLAGMITGLRAQGLAPFEASAAGAWVHAQAGLLAAEKIGHVASVLAGDVIEAIPDVLTEL
jgi:NAD(P)H-hydrate epimerase